MACKSCNTNKPKQSSVSKPKTTSSTRTSGSTANCIGANCYESRYKKPSQFVGRRRSSINEDKCCDDINLDNKYVDWMWEDYICEELDIPPPPEYPLPEIPVCTIDSIELGNQGTCITGIDTYYQDLVVTYTSAPTAGSLVVNGQSFSITGSPQNVRLANLSADGSSVSITASFSTRPLCRTQLDNLFTAPAACTPPPDVILPDPPPDPPAINYCGFGGTFEFVSSTTSVVPPNGPAANLRFLFPGPKDLGITRVGVEFYSTEGNIAPGGQVYFYYGSITSGGFIPIGTYTIPSGDVLAWVTFNPNLATGTVGFTYPHGMLRMYYYPNNNTRHEVSGGGSLNNLCSNVESSRPGYTILNL